MHACVVVTKLFRTQTCNLCHQCHAQLLVLGIRQTCNSGALQMLPQVSSAADGQTQMVSSSSEIGGRTCLTRRVSLKMHLCWISCDWCHKTSQEFHSYLRSFLTGRNTSCILSSSFPNTKGANVHAMILTFWRIKSVGCVQVWMACVVRWHLPSGCWTAFQFFSKWLRMVGVFSKKNCSTFMINTAASHCIEAHCVASVCKKGVQRKLTQKNTLVDQGSPSTHSTDHFHDDPA